MVENLPGLLLQIVLNIMIVLCLDVCVTGYSVTDYNVNGSGPSLSNERFTQRGYYRAK